MEYRHWCYLSNVLWCLRVAWLQTCKNDYIHGKQRSGEGRYSIYEYLLFVFKPDEVLDQVGYSEGTVKIYWRAPIEDIMGPEHFQLPIGEENISS